MGKERRFVEHLRSRILDAFNNHLMQIQNPDLGGYYETKEDLMDMLEKESWYLQKKRDQILQEINRFLAGGA
ncbi:MAG: hypothetical protein ACLFUP_04680 [Desulfobacteraceae bacterium]